MGEWVRTRIWIERALWLQLSDFSEFSIEHTIALLRRRYRHFSRSRRFLSRISFDFNVGFPPPIQDLIGLKNAPASPFAFTVHSASAGSFSLLLFLVDIAECKIALNVYNWVAAEIFHTKYFCFAFLGGQTWNSTVSRLYVPRNTTGKVFHSEQERESEAEKEIKLNKTTATFFHGEWSKQTIFHSQFSFSFSIQFFVLHSSLCQISSAFCAGPNAKERERETKN